MVIPKVRVLNKIQLHGFTPHSTNNLWWATGYGERKIDGYYKVWKTAIRDRLPEKFCPPDMSGFGLGIEVGVGSEFDLDNTLKAIIDALEEKYCFNDNELGYLYARKYVTGSYEDGTHESRNDFIDISLLEMIELVDNESRPIPPWDAERVKQWRGAIPESEKG